MKNDIKKHQIDTVNVQFGVSLITLVEVHNYWHPWEKLFFIYLIYF